MRSAGAPEATHWTGWLINAVAPKLQCELTEVVSVAPQLSLTRSNSGLRWENETDKRWARVCLLVDIWSQRCRWTLTRFWRQFKPRKSGQMVGGKQRRNRSHEWSSEFHPISPENSYRIISALKFPEKSRNSHFLWCESQTRLWYLLQFLRINIETST